MDSTIRAVQKHGASVSMDQIAAEAKTSKTMIYKYFTDKAGLQKAISLRYVSDLLNAVPEGDVQPAGSIESLRPLLEHFFSLIEKEPELYFFINMAQFNNQVSTARFVRFDALAEAVVLEALREISPDSELTSLGKAAARTWNDGMRAVVIAVAERWLKARVSANDPHRERIDGFDEAEDALAHVTASRLIDQLIGQIDCSLSYLVEVEWPNAAMQIGTNL